MGLLDNLKNNTNANGDKPMNALQAAMMNKEKETTQAQPAPNPLLAALQQSQGAAPVNPLAQANPLAPQSNPLAPPAPEPEAPTVEEKVEPETVVETPQEEVKEEAKPVEEPKAEPAVEEKTEEPAETVAEVTVEPKEEPKEEEAPNEEPKKEEVKEEPKKEEKPKTTTKRGSRSKSKSVPAAEVETDTIEVPRTAVGFDQAIAAIKSPFADETWNTFKQAVEEELDAIVISQDMNPGTLKITLEELSIIREKLWSPLQQYKAEYENMTSREPEGLIEQVKRINVSGGNEMDRRKAGVLAAMSHKAPDGTTINLFELAAELRGRYGFLRAAMDHVKYKTDVLITMSGALKLENNHIK